ncbi:M28 family peptidase [Chitinophaga sp. MM2321]|uniref:M28 family peptidase n=1 Tax=Chitinophaga sp. MM2321 TaxID=3137178 RepID=UPI0032D56E64
MKKITWLLPLVLTTMFANAQKKNDRKTLTNLQQHINYLNNDKLEGCRTGTPGEQLAAAYISSQLRQMDITPKGADGFLQTFTISERREPTGTCAMSVNKDPLHVGTQFIPLPFSAGKSAKGEALPNVNEPDNIWLINVSELDTGHFKSRLALYQQQTQIAAQSGATAVVFYNGKETPEEVNGWLAQNPPLSTIPAVWVNADISKKINADDASAFQIELQVSLEKVKHTGTNVIGYIDNKAPKTVVIGAHYDHGDYDNASGTAALLEIARLLKTSRFQHHNYLIIAFSGNEQGLSGSKYFTTHSNVELSQINYMINMDMIGQLDPAKGLQISGTGSSPGWPAIISGAAARETKLVYDSSGIGSSDHTSFYNKNIPVLSFFTGHHSGNTGNINYNGALSVVKLVYDIIGKTNSMEKLVFSSTPQATAKK